MIKCNAGNKPCGGRCVPQKFKCAEDKISQNKLNPPISPVESTQESKLPSKVAQDKPLPAKPVPNPNDPIVKQAKSDGVKNFAKIAIIGGVVTGAGLIAWNEVDRIRVKDEMIKVDDSAAESPEKYIKDGEDLQPGDLIRKPSAVMGMFNVYHYGVYMGDGKVMHNMVLQNEDGKNYSQIGEQTFEDNYQKSKAIAPYKWEKVQTNSKFSPEEVIERIDAWKQKDVSIAFDLYTLNCEHLARYIVEGKAYATQTEEKKSALIRIVSWFNPFNNTFKADNTSGGIISRKTLESAGGSMNFAEKIESKMKKGQSATKKNKNESIETEVDLPIANESNMSDFKQAIQLFTTKSRDKESAIKSLAAWMATYGYKMVQQ